MSGIIYFKYYKKFKIFKKTSLHCPQKILGIVQNFPVLSAKSRKKLTGYGWWRKNFFTKLRYRPLFWSMILSSESFRRSLRYHMQIFALSALKACSLKIKQCFRISWICQQTNKQWLVTTTLQMKYPKHITRSIHQDYHPTS